MTRFKQILLASAAVAFLSGCNDTLESVADKVNQPLPRAIVAKMEANGMRAGSPIMMRIFKQEGVLEVWKQKDDGRYGKIAEYEICAWSGDLGPKKVEGDHQTPEGFYVIRPAQMNPNSSYYLSFNIGYPNAFDGAHGRTGSNIMVHGACSSAGCFSMTDENVAQIYAFARDAFKGGQRAFQVEAFPFRMTPENMVKHRHNENYDFWKMLKVGYDFFEVTKQPPEVEVCDSKYVFNQQLLEDSKFTATSACPKMTTPEPLRVAYAAYRQQYEQAYEAKLAEEQQETQRQTMLARREEERTRKQARMKVKTAEREQAAEEFFSPVTALLPDALQSSPSQDAAALAATGEAASRQASPESVPNEGTAIALPSDAPKPTPNPAADNAALTTGALPGRPADGDGTAAARRAPPAPASPEKKPFWKFWGE